MPVDPRLRRPRHAVLRALCFLGTEADEPLAKFDAVFPQELHGIFHTRPEVAAESCPAALSDAGPHRGRSH